MLWGIFGDSSILTQINIHKCNRRTPKKANFPIYIGESIGLSIVSRFHDLIEADWIPIPEGKFRTFDYQITSTGDKIIQVEAKGTSVEDNRQKSKNVREQKNRMDAKKKRRG